MHPSRGENRTRSVDPKSGAGGVNNGWTLWPDSSDYSQPPVQTLSRLPRARIFATAKLADQPEVTEQGDAFPALRHETAIREPHKQIKRGRRARKDLCGLHVGRNRVAHDFVEEFITKYDLVLKPAGQRRVVR